MIYLISEGADGPCKIGISVMTASRLAALQTGNPRRLSVASTWPSSAWAEDREVEACIHFDLNAKRLVGEWFSVTEAEGRAAVEVVLLTFGRREQYYAPIDRPAQLSAPEIMKNHPLALPHLERLPVAPFHNATKPRKPLIGRA